MSLFSKVNIYDNFLCILQKNMQISLFVCVHIYVYEYTFIHTQMQIYFYIKKSKLYIYSSIPLPHQLIMVCLGDISTPK